MIGVLLLACRGGSDTGASDCAVTWDGWADGFFATYCQSCHAAESPERNGAPEGSNLESEADIVSWADRIAVRVLEEGTMPIGGGIPADELILLERYLECVQ